MMPDLSLEPLSGGGRNGEAVYAYRIYDLKSSIAASGTIVFVRRRHSFRIHPCGIPSFWEGQLLNKFNIALDGPAGAGKSTVARLVANELGFVYIDTGAMYRAVTWKVLELGIHADQTAKVIETAKVMDIVLQPGPTGQQVLVDGEDVTDRIRSAAINANVSLIAQIAEVRELLVSKQKAMAASKGVVMDGRDIGTQVLPDAEVKIFLTASARERAERRYKEMDKPAITVEQLELEIARRDKLDSEREVSPLVQAQDAVLLDSSNIPLQDVVGKVLELCRAKVSGGA